MTSADLIKIHEQIFREAKEIIKKKNHDYGSAHDPFFNLTSVERCNICSTEQGILTRLSDKFCRLINFVDKRELKVEDESLKDTVIDAINYLILIFSYIEQKESKEIEWPNGRKSNNNILKKSEIKQYFGRLRKKVS